MLCVLIWITSSRQFKWVHTTYHYYIKTGKDNPEVSPFASWPGAMINPQWFELPMSQTDFHGPKDVWAIEVRLYVTVCLCCSLFVCGFICGICFVIVCSSFLLLLVHRNCGIFLLSSLIFLTFHANCLLSCVKCQSLFAGKTKKYISTRHLLVFPAC